MRRGLVKERDPSAVRAMHRSGEKSHADIDDAPQKNVRFLL